MAQANRLQALLDLSRSLSSSLELREVLREFATRAAELTGATAAELSTYDPARGDLVMLVEYRGGTDEITEKGGQVYHLSGVPGDPPRARHAGGLARSASTNPDDDAAERALLVQQGQKSLLMLPLVARGETIGLMEIVDVRDRVWDDADVEFCRALCDIVATAVRNARLFAELQETAARDKLTGLYNRRLFEEQFEAAVARSLRTQEDLDAPDRRPRRAQADQRRQRPRRRRSGAADARGRAAGDDPRDGRRLPARRRRVRASSFPARRADDAIEVAERAQETLAEIGRGPVQLLGRDRPRHAGPVVRRGRLPLGRPRRLPRQGRRWRPHAPRGRDQRRGGELGVQ